jgi:hypothetical protein
LIAGLFLIGFGEEFAEIGEVEVLDHGSGGWKTLWYRKKRERAPSAAKAGVEQVSYRSGEALRQPRARTLW